MRLRIRLVVQGLAMSPKLVLPLAYTAILSLITIHFVANPLPVSLVRHRIVVPLVVLKVPSIALIGPDELWIVCHVRFKCLPVSTNGQPCATRPSGTEMQLVSQSLMPLPRMYLRPDSPSWIAGLRLCFEHG
jgi:hypothetical protein